MTAVDVEIDARGLERVQRAIAGLSRLDMGRALDRIGALVVSQTQARLSSGKRAPDGSPWKRWSEKTAARARAGQSLLERTGALRESIDHEVSGDEVLVGSALPYAATHQFGDSGRNIPARPYIGISDEDETDIEETILDWIEREVGGAFRGRAA